MDVALQGLCFIVQMVEVEGFGVLACVFGISDLGLGAGKVFGV